MVGVVQAWVEELNWERLGQELRLGLALTGLIMSWMLSRGRKVMAAQFVMFWLPFTFIVIIEKK